MMKPALVVEAYRGSEVESQHLVDAIVMDSSYQILSLWGDSQRKFSPRSMIKMLQAQLLFETGAVSKFQLSQEELTLACASHHGEVFQTSVILEWLNRIGLSAADLVCGPHDPADKETAIEIWRHQQKPQKYHNNCSGKHAGLLSACLQMNADPHTYFEYKNPVQVSLRKIMSHASGFDFTSEFKSPWGIDGCGIPTYFAGLEVWARAMASLLQAGNQAAQSLQAAVRDCPRFVSGTQGFCTHLIINSDGEILPKAGAEGVYLALVPEQKLVVIVKARDGSMRAAKSSLLWILKNELQLITDQQEFAMMPYSETLIKNWAGLDVGRVLTRQGI
jgi:L-asparaginase II